MIHTESTWNKRADWLVAAQSESDMKEWILAFKVNISHLNAAWYYSIAFCPLSLPLRTLYDIRLALTN